VRGRCILLLTIALGLCACDTQRRPRPGQRAGPAEMGSPFAPVSISLHPLTRIDRDPNGQPMIVAYLDVRDEWEDATKTIGSLQVQLYRPSSGPVSGSDEQELTWDLDLSDLDRNARLYDPVTHMYRLPLIEAPPWIMPESDRDPPRIRLRAVLNTFSPTGEARQLEDDLLIGG
jgi:hypothetical protein